MEKKIQTNNPFGLIVGLFITFVMLMGLFFIAKFIFKMLWFLIPVFLIITAIIDYKVILNYVKMLINMTKKSPVMGILLILLSIPGMAVIAPLMLGKALLNRKVDKVTKEQERRKGEFIQYEEVRPESAPEDKPLLELHDDPRPNPLDKSKPKPKTKTMEDYDKLFEDLDFEENEKPPTKLW